MDDSSVSDSDSSNSSDASGSMSSAAEGASSEGAVPGRGPAHVTGLCAEAVVVLLSPNHSMHRTIQKALGRGSMLDANDLALFNRLMFQPPRLLSQHLSALFLPFLGSSIASLHGSPPRRPSQPEPPSEAETLRRQTLLETLTTSDGIRHHHRTPDQTSSLGFFAASPSASLATQRPKSSGRGEQWEPPPPPRPHPLPPGYCSTLMFLWLSGPEEPDRCPCCDPHFLGIRFVAELVTAYAAIRSHRDPLPPRRVLHSLRPQLGRDFALHSGGLQWLSMFVTLHLGGASSQSLALALTAIRFMAKVCLSLTPPCKQAKAAAPARALP